MTVSADVIDRFLAKTSSHQGVPRRRAGADDSPADPALGQHPLKVVLSHTERAMGRWTGQADSLYAVRMVKDAPDHNAGSVYERIKARLAQGCWPPGELLQIGIFARELGTSTTPVREALVRLAAERLIAYAPKKGFLVKAMTEGELRGLYLVNQMHLQAALDYSCGRASELLESCFSRPGPLQFESGEKATALAHLTACFFSGLAALAGIEEIAVAVRNINDRLYRPRLAECCFIDDSPYELSSINDLLLAGERRELHHAIRCYHERRLERVPSICKELLSMSFAKR